MYVKKLEIVDENRDKVIVLKDVRVEKAMKKMVSVCRAKDGEGVLRRIMAYLDKDFRELLGVDDHEKK